MRRADQSANVVSSFLFDVGAVRDSGYRREPKPLVQPSGFRALGPPPESLEPPRCNRNDRSHPLLADPTTEVRSDDIQPTNPAGGFVCRVWVGIVGAPRYRMDLADGDRYWLEVLADEFWTMVNREMWSFEGTSLGYWEGVEKREEHRVLRAG
jgi:hypothetical protein